MRIRKTRYASGLLLAGLSVGTPHSAAHAANMAGGDRIYEQRCAACHGANGRGDGPVAGSLKQKPWSFADKKRMAQEKDDRHFTKVITEGSGPMPPFGRQLSQADVNDAILHIRMFAK